MEPTINKEARATIVNMEFQNVMEMLEDVKLMSEQLKNDAYQKISYFIGGKHMPIEPDNIALKCDAPDCWIDDVVRLLDIIKGNMEFTKDTIDTL
jgi:hypothetical protein